MKNACRTTPILAFETSACCENYYSPKSCWNPLGRSWVIHSLPNNLTLHNTEEKITIVATALSLQTQLPWSPTIQNPDCTMLVSKGFVIIYWSLEESFLSFLLPLSHREVRGQGELTSKGKYTLSRCLPIWATQDTIWGTVVIKSAICPQLDDSCKPHYAPVFSCLCCRYCFVKISYFLFIHLTLP